MEVHFDENFRKYEVVILMDPDSSLQEQQKLFQKNKEIIESFKGQVHHVETWGKRNLANPFKKHHKAIYFHSSFYAEAPAIHELERTMRINDRVLRFLHTRIDDRIPLNDYLDAFHQNLKDALAREKERQEKSQKKREQKSKQ